MYPPQPQHDYGFIEPPVYLFTKMLSMADDARGLTLRGAKELEGKGVWLHTPMLMGRVDIIYPHMTGKNSYIVQEDWQLFQTANHFTKIHCWFVEEDSKANLIIEKV